MEQQINIEWIVKIEKTPDVEDEIPQRIRVVFEPIVESLYFYGEARIKNNKWSVFSEEINGMTISLELLQEKMETVVTIMRKRLVEYENLNKGFGVLKWIEYNEEESI